MSLHDDRPPERPRTSEEILAEAKPVPPRAGMVFEDLIEAEDEDFWKAITEA